MDAREMLANITVATTPHMDKNDRSEVIEAIQHKATHPLDLDLFDEVDSEQGLATLKNIFGG